MPDITPSQSWRADAQLFFDARSQQISTVPTLTELCFVSGRDPRIWSQADTYAEMMDSIVELCAIDHTSSVIEIGCAAGYIACGIAPRVARYVGVDISFHALEVARRLGLKNAEFRHQDASALCDHDGAYDSAVAYDVLTNFPTFSEVEPVLTEMLRIVRPGGRVVLGSVPDAACEAEFLDASKRIPAALERQFGLPWTPTPMRTPSLIDRVLARIGLKNVVAAQNGRVVCYYFSKSDFVRFAERIGIELAFKPVHRRNPYAEFRFNAVFTKPA